MARGGGRGSGREHRGADKRPIPPGESKRVFKWQDPKQKLQLQAGGRNVAKLAATTALGFKRKPRFQLPGILENLDKGNRWLELAVKSGRAQFWPDPAGPSAGPFSPRGGTHLRVRPKGSSAGLGQGGGECTGQDAGAQGLVGARVRLGEAVFISSVLGHWGSCSLWLL